MPRFCDSSTALSPTPASLRTTDRGRCPKDTARRARRGNLPGSTDQLKAQILYRIRMDGPITAAELADRIPILTHDPVRLVRRKIRELIMADRIPVASSMIPPYGYFIVNGSREADVEAYCRQLRNRLESIAQRLARFRSSAASRVQQVLFEEFGPPDTSDRSYPSDSEKEAHCPPNE